MMLHRIGVLVLAILSHLAKGYDFSDVIKGIDQLKMPNKYIVVNRIGQCVGFKNATIAASEFRITRFNKSYTLVNGELTFHDDFPDGYDIAIQLNNCDDFKSPASCRRLECPIGKGTYAMVNYAPDKGLVALLPGSSKSYWEIKFISKQNDRLMSCIMIGITIRPLKTKN
ncbi:uncharacterized protein LOC129771351 [Toxorhynchites rutilus septentrionalis]|uniref:uncharacterized protein LOC129771351 n=1 Tax=Toxorhynchites rutilus septentrionalis TaxID=329112 RepID=UPI002479E246|nr:uncharacterized protein LOC129771351 [Toxorhynchites rutilus septentrionalis]